MNNEVRVRIAPSPTGYLHIGTARTALFNYLFVKKHGGKFLLRIEDTDFARNNEESYNSILNGLKFLGLEWDGEVLYQSTWMEEHYKIAQKPVEKGSAYYCYLTQEEIARRKEKAESEGGRYIHRYTAGDETPVDGVLPVIRMKVPRNQDIINEDLVQGRVIINSETIEDFVIIRSDKTPIYMLSVVCDDIFMGITHVIRGDDHLANTPKQILIYRGIGAKEPKFAHIPLIHGMDGKKLSKRHGALAVAEYSNMGYLPQAILSYLVRLGWGSENDAILTKDEMVQAFSLEGISKSPARFDFEKLNNVNHHFIVNLPEGQIYALLEKDFQNKERLARAVSKIRYRYNKITDMKQDFACFEDGFAVNEDAKEILTSSKDVAPFALEFMEKSAGDEAVLKKLCKDAGIPLGKIFPFIRACLTGKITSVGVFEIIYILGNEEAVRRLKAFHVL